MNKDDYRNIIIGILLGIGMSLGKLLSYFLYSKAGQEFLSNLFNLIKQNMWLILFLVVAATIIYIARTQTFQAFLRSSNSNSPRINIASVPSKIAVETIPDRIKNILENLVKDNIKDPITQELFRPGEKIHLCSVHQLAYHEDSWQEIGYKCQDCGNGSNTKVYTIPDDGWKPQIKIQHIR